MHTYSYPDYSKNESLIVANSHTISSTQREMAMESSVLHK